ATRRAPRPRARRRATPSRLFPQCSSRALPSPGLCTMIAVMRNPATLLLVFSLLACGRGDAQVPAVNAPHDPLLQHHEIRADRLPAPYATQSAGNPPIVVAPTADARFHLPPGFRINLYASGFDDPRTMLLGSNGDVIVAEPGGGKIT